MTETRCRPVWQAMVAGALVVALGACSSTAIRTPAGANASASAGRPGASVVVQRGDTLYSIARRQGLAVGDVARWNGLQPPYTIYPGQRLALSGSGGGQVAAAPRPASSAGAAPAPAASAPKPATPAPAAPPASSGFAWRWPAQGTLINGFVAGDNTRQGIDIGGSTGQAVNAAADGVVVYSGAGLVGYGELIIVKHNEQWLSAYGHNRKRLVNEGQNVKAGEQIAEMGRTGTSRDMLHFEIRHNGKPVDPQLYLPKR